MKSSCGKAGAGQVRIGAQNGLPSLALRGLVAEGSITVENSVSPDFTATSPCWSHSISLVGVTKGGTRGRGEKKGFYAQEEARPTRRAERGVIFHEGEATLQNSSEYQWEIGGQAAFPKAGVSQKD